MERVFEVFGLGQCAYDRLGFVAEHPDPDQKAQIEELTVECGGPVGTALVALAGWGRRCAVAGLVGDDPEGRRVRADLETAGVDTKGLIERPGGLTQQAFIAVERGSGRRTIYWQRPKGAEPGAGEVELPEAAVFLTDGLFAEASVALARRAERVVVDAGTLRPGTEALIDHAEVFVASESFARAFVGEDDPEGACRRLRERGVAVAGVTLGARGYVASYGDRWLHRPAHGGVEVVDTTGCGDLFHAGLVEGMLSGWPWERSFDFAAWAAARCATRLGGRAGIPRRDEYPGRDGML